MTPYTPRDVAQWMAEQLEQQPYLYQETAVWTVKERFGDAFVRENEDGNLAFTPAVLQAFRELNEETVVWEAAELAWRKRRPTDPPGRRAE